MRLNERVIEAGHPDSFLHEPLEIDVGNNHLFSGCKALCLGQ
jgi:hypothetical protein